MAEHPYMIGRWVGGTMVFTGNLVWRYNMWMTAREGTVCPGAVTLMSLPMSAREILKSGSTG